MVFTIAIKICKNKVRLLLPFAVGFPNWDKKVEFTSVFLSGATRYLFSESFR